MCEMKARKVAISSSNAVAFSSLPCRSRASWASAESRSICARMRSRHSPAACCCCKRPASCANKATCWSCCWWLRCNTFSCPCCSLIICTPACASCLKATISSSFSASSHSVLANRRRSVATCMSICCAAASSTAWRLPAVASTCAEIAPTVPVASSKRKSASRTCSCNRVASSSLASTSARSSRSSTSWAVTSCPSPSGDSSLWGLPTENATDAGDLGDHVSSPVCGGRALARRVALRTGLPGQGLGTHDKVLLSVRTGDGAFSAFASA
mmetsp:Transcript_82376/g.191306  ORF Transcript_82376/g.191306 Transcript_82376/m.191306 type:complete len:270 (-) Transcript_82376:525-1334(-)